VLWGIGRLNFSSALCLRRSLRLRFNYEGHHSLKRHSQKLIANGLFCFRTLCHSSSFTLRRNCSLKFRRASPFALPLNSRRCNALNCGNGCNTCPCQQAQPEPFSFSHFFLHFFSSFLSPSFFSLRISKRTMLCNTKDDAAHWLWKRWEAWLMPFS